MNDLPDLPFLDFCDTALSTRGPEVLDARARHWCARTPFGLAILRHRQAGQLLRDRRLRQGSYAWPRHMGLQGSFAEFWSASVIAQEGIDHKKLRTLAVPVLSQDYIDTLIPTFDQVADALAVGLVEKGAVEFQRDFAVPFAGRAICALLAIDQGRWPQVSHDASTLGLAMGIDAKAHEPAVNAACDRLMDMATELLDRAHRGRDPDGYVGRLFASAAEIGGLTELDLQNLIVISVFGGVDTTRAQLGFLMALFIAYPDQWHALRRDHSLASAAVEEAIRHRPTTTWSTREAVESFKFDGVEIKKGQTLHVLVHASATDPLVMTSEGFDLRAKRKIHFGFGGGAHNCLGQAVARTDIACALRALATRISHFDYSRDPEWLPDSGNTSPVQIPLTITA